MSLQLKLYEDFHYLFFDVLKSLTFKKVLEQTVNNELDLRGKMTPEQS